MKKGSLEDPLWTLSLPVWLGACLYLGVFALPGEGETLHVAAWAVGIVGPPRLDDLRRIAPVDVEAARVEQERPDRSRSSLGDPDSTLQERLSV